MKQRTILHEGARCIHCMDLLRPYNERYMPQRYVNCESYSTSLADDDADAPCARYFLDWHSPDGKWWYVRKILLTAWNKWDKE